MLLGGIDNASAESVANGARAGSDLVFLPWLPMMIRGQMRRGVSPSVNAISTIMLAVTLLLVLLVRRFSDVRFR